jgi:hypothetical protein
MSDAKTKGAQNTQRVYDLIASNFENKINDRAFVEEWFS